MGFEYTALVPAKNAHSYIEATLDSIYAQSLPAKEVIVVLDGADESLEAIVRRHNPATTVHVVPSKGQASALNFGIRSATTEYLSPLDADDLWHPEKMKSQLDFLNDHAEYDAVVSGVRNFIDGTDGYKEGSSGEISKEYGASRMIGVSTFRIGVFEKFGFLPEDVSHFQWHYQWWPEVVTSGLKYGELPDIHLFRRIHKQNSWVERKDEGASALIAFLRAHKNQVTGE